MCLLGRACQPIKRCCSTVLLDHMSLRTHLSILVVALIWFVADFDSSRARVLAQSRQRTPAPSLATPLAPAAVESPFVGKWTYRSFLSNPDISVEPNVLFGRRTMQLSYAEPDRVSGTLGERDQQVTKMMWPALYAVSRLFGVSMAALSRNEE